MKKPIKSLRNHLKPYKKPLNTVKNARFRHVFVAKRLEQARGTGAHGVSGHPPSAPRLWHHGARSPRGPDSLGPAISSRPRPLERPGWPRSCSSPIGEMAHERPVFQGVLASKRPLLACFIRRLGCLGLNYSPGKALSVASLHAVARLLRQHAARGHYEDEVGRHLQAALQPRGLVAEDLQDAWRRTSKRMGYSIYSVAFGMI